MLKIVQTKPRKVILIIILCSLLLAISLMTFNQIHINTYNFSYITTDGWNNVVNSNSFLDIHYAEITNHANNLGDVEIRVVNKSDDSKIIIEPTVVQAGSSYKTGKIKASNYIIQTKAIDEAGNYIIHVGGF